MIRKKTVFAFIIVFVLMIPTFRQSSGMGSMNRIEGKGLYFYSKSELVRFLEERGYSDYKPKSDHYIRRNSVGSGLWFIDVYSRKKKALLVSCNGSIKEIDVPSSLVWLNDESQALAWFDIDKGRVYYKNGRSEEPPYMADNRADPTGIYFMKSIESSISKGISEGTAIYSIEAPNIELAKMMKFHGHRIFSKDGKVIVFGDYFDSRNEQSEMYVFERKSNELVQVEKVIIRRPHKSPAPFVVEDLSPWGDEALFVDVHDGLSRSEIYIFNLKTHEMKKIGKEPFGGGWGFYLQCDIIKKVTEEQNKRKGSNGN